MFFRLERRSLILISIFIFLLIISISVYYIADNNLVRRVFFFPDMNSFSGEVRRVPRQASLEDDVELFVKEMILGPYSIEHFRIIPENTKLHALFLRNHSVLYIDFSSDLIVTESEFTIMPSNMMAMIRKNIKYNFPVLEEITLSVDGQTL